MGRQTRPETGPMRFGGDWPGLFIRGDDAFRLLMGLRNPTPLFDAVKWLEELLISTNMQAGAFDEKSVQPMWEFDKCYTKII